MLKICRNILITGCIVLSVGCSAMRSKGHSFEMAPETPSNNLATLYIYRVGAYPKKRAPEISIDGHPIFSPSEEDYTWLYLSKGKHYVKLGWAWDTGWPDLNFVIDLTDRKELFLKISGDIKRHAFSKGSTAYDELSSFANEVAPADAIIELKYCCGYRESTTSKIE